MVFKSLDPTVKEKVLAAYRGGQHRNQIVRELQKKGVRVSQGTVSKLIHQESTHEVDIRTTSAIIKIAEPSTSVKGVEPPSAIVVNRPLPPSGGPLRHLVEQEASEVESRIDNIINRYVIKEGQTVEKENFDQCRALEDSSRYSDSRDQEKIQTQTQIMPQWAIDLNDTISRHKQQVQHWLALVAHHKGLLENQRQSLMELKQTMDKEAAEIKAQKEELKEIEPWLEMIKEVAQSKNMDVKEAATFVAQELKLSQEFGGIQRQIEIAQGELKMLNISIAQKQPIVTTLLKLQQNGVKDDDIIGLSKMIDLSRMGREWIPRQGQGNENNGNGNLQQPNNGNGNFSDWVRLNLLRNNTTNMLNRMVVACRS
jgi:hypothetical protein